MPHVCRRALSCIDGPGEQTQSVRGQSRARLTQRHWPSRGSSFSSRGNVTPGNRAQAFPQSQALETDTTPRACELTTAHGSHSPSRAAAEPPQSVCLTLDKINLFSSKLKARELTAGRMTNGKQPRKIKVHFELVNWTCGIHSKFNRAFNFESLVPEQRSGLAQKAVSSYSLTLLPI